MNTKACEYIRGLHVLERKAICQKCGISYSWLMQLAYCKRDVSPKLAKRLEKVTMGELRKEDLRPDINWDLLTK